MSQTSYARRSCGMASPSAAMRCQWACTACARVRLISENPLATSDARAWTRRSRSSMPTRTMPVPSKSDSRAM
eukprot:5080902-Lingulodinium_polyedra.AAC.1